MDESIHARQPYVAGYRQEYARWRGYEEGLAEGLARIVVRDWAGLDPIESAYGYYIAGYASLARVAEVDLEYLWRRVWQVPTGRVRNTFTDALDELRSQRATAALTARQGATLRGVADTMFGSDRRDAIPNQDAVMRLWEAALR